jgi:hypothetical protein
VNRSHVDCLGHGVEETRLTEFTFEGSSFFFMDLHVFLKANDVSQNSLTNGTIYFSFSLMCHLLVSEESGFVIECLRASWERAFVDLVNRSHVFCQVDLEWEAGFTGLTFVRTVFGVKFFMDLHMVSKARFDQGIITNRALNLYRPSLIARLDFLFLIVIGTSLIVVPLMLD